MTFAARGSLLLGAAIAAVSLLLPLHVVAEEPIRIGAVYSLSGWGAVGGSAELHGAQLAVEEINAQGGIAGRPLELVVEDTQSNPARAVTAFKRLVEVEHVPAVLGPNWTEFSEALAPLAGFHRVPLLSASGAGGSRGGEPYFFTTLPEFDVHVAPVVKEVLARQYRRIAILKTSSAYFEGLAGATERLLRAAERGPEMVASFPPQTTDFRAVITRLKSERYDAVLVYLLEGGDTLSFFRQSREQMIEAQLYTHDISLDEGMRKVPAAAEGVRFIRYEMPFDTTLAGRYERRFGVSPTVGVPKTYDNVFLLKVAMERCGFAVEQIRRCLQMVDYDGVSGRIRFDAAGRIIKPAPISVLYTVKEGRFMPAAN